VRTFFRECHVVMGAALAVALAVPAAGQVLDGRPIVLGDGRVTIGGSVTGTLGCAVGPSVQGCGDDTGFFNYTDYEHSALQGLQLEVSTSVRATSRVEFLAEVRSDNVSRPEPYALFVRVRPWPKRRFDIQAGRIPPTFGAFSRRVYPSDNLLIGYPLGYQYLTSLRHDALPSNADALLRMRGRGWLSSFDVGNRTPHGGMPLVNAFGWDTGVQLHAANDLVDAAFAVTSGTLSHPLVDDDNDGKQAAGRVSVRPLPGLVVGASGARGSWIAREAVEAAGLGFQGSDLAQRAWGADAEFSRDHYLVRMEAIVSDWQLPAVAAPAIDGPVRAVSAFVEGRYRIRPGLYAAARVDRLAFSDIVGTNGPNEWDAPVTRVEVGGGYSLMRNLVLKLAVQRNTRDTTRTPSRTFVATQAVFWF
jgi:hypothetical protein